MRDAPVYRENGIANASDGNLKRRKTMAKNDYLYRQRERERAILEAGIQIGRQQMCDYLTLALRDPETMGKDTFSGKRIVKVINKINDLMCKFSSAFEKSDEADYYQEKLDCALRETYRDEIREYFFSFNERYEIVKKFDYNKRKWK